MESPTPCDYAVTRGGGLTVDCCVTTRECRPWARRHPLPPTEGFDVRYSGVQYDDEGRLPTGCDWAFIEVGDQLILLCKRLGWSPQLMADAWQEFTQGHAA